MHPIDVVGKVCQNDKAHATASKMPKLRHLEIGNMPIKTKVVVKVASDCHDIKFLDLCGCWDVDDKLLLEKFPGLKTLSPCVATAIRTASGRIAPMTRMMTTSTHAKVHGRHENHIWEVCIVHELFP
jgi:hypothetical protein